MKKRITLTIDAEVAKRAQKIADSRKTTISAVIEECVRTAPDNGHEFRPSRRSGKSRVSFVDKWRGKLRLRSSSKRDPLLEALKNKYGLDDE
jgi:hypothetical protein